MQKNSSYYKKTKFACYYTFLAMSSAFSLPPILFLTFRQMYFISYTLLGTLVLTNFCTQLIVDLIFSFFTKYFNIQKTIQIMPLLTSLGFLVYAIVPTLFPQYAYAGLFSGTVIFSIAAGLCEVLLSPLIAAIPSKTPEKDMSLLHSLYAYGVVSVVIISTVFLKIFGNENWMYLTLFLAVLPIISSLLFFTSPFPPINISGNSSNTTVKQNSGLFLCVICIFLGGAAENAMTNWISSYLESALHISKTLGDILGFTMFAVLLGLGRTLYAKYEKNISTVLLGGMFGATICYLIAGLSPIPLLSMLACILTGLCTSMLWPGTLILMEEKFPNPGVTAYALMAAGGDLGGSVAPQMLGAIVDSVSTSSWAETLGNKLSLTAEQIGMKTGMLTATIFPILGVIILIIIKKTFAKR
ncbi:MAG: MFS transporter [Ruminococcaceae bacterium]|nr:MFS transporter [Oscillospiraceae bacterium]